MTTKGAAALAKEDREMRAAVRGVVASLPEAHVTFAGDMLADVAEALGLPPAARHESPSTRSAAQQPRV